MPSYRIPQIKLSPDQGGEELERRILAVLATSRGNLLTWKIERKSVDARDKTDIRLIYGVRAELKNAVRGIGEGRAWHRVAAEAESEFPFGAPQADADTQCAHSPIIVGSGPAGLFCALLLARNGYAPLLLERGDDVDARARKVETFWKEGRLDPDSNMQFGEGGAGTFSDGKLNTSIADREGLAAWILAEFIRAGAPEEIGYSNKPHIGTDRLVGVVKNLRKSIEASGGTVRFGAKLTGISATDGRVSSIEVNREEIMPAEVLVLAIGHSARDTYELLASGSVPMERKPFAIGLRIEHPQAMIQRSQYGKFWNHPTLPVADYKLSHQTGGGRGVYSFCMCPGGHVVNASSESGMVVCNGMSYFARDARNANSAVVVTVRPEDFGSADILAGVEFQRRWERAAFLAANPDRSREGAGDGAFAMPVQRFGDFVDGKTSLSFGKIQPCARGAVGMADLNACLPDYVAEAIKEGIIAFGRKIKGFADPDAILTGVETRTSSPVRILRDEGFQSALCGLFPCGEGAGYAGGIMSAAMDGIRVARAVAMSISGENSPHIMPRTS